MTIAAARFAIQCPIDMPPDFVGRGASQMRAVAIKSMAEVAQKT